MENINRQISDYFLTDSRDFLLRYKLLEEKSIGGPIGLRSKLLVELLFALECALKALIFIESTESEKLTYKKIKKQGHNINKLIDCLSKSSQAEYKHIISIDLSKYEVYCRYQLESQIDFRECSGVLGKKYYSTIANFRWLDDIYRQVECFIDYVRNQNPVELTIKNLSDIDFNREMNKHYILINIRK